MAAALIGISGTLMLTAGFSLPIGWASARPFLLAGGPSVQAAFLIQRRAIDRPHASTRSSATTQGAASALILLAGIALVTIGYDAAHQGWWPISTTTVIPIAAAIIASNLNITARPSSTDAGFGIQMRPVIVRQSGLTLVPMTARL